MKLIKIWVNRMKMSVLVTLVPSAQIPWSTCKCT